MSLQPPSEPFNRRMLCVVLPTYNEVANIGHVIGDIAAHDTEGRIKRVIFVDDNSSDGTSDLIKGFDKPVPFDIICLERVGRVGLSSAIAEGIMAADTELVAVMDCDGQHQARDLFAMLDTAQATDADIVIGSRFKEVQRQDSHQGTRHTLSRAGIGLANVLLKREVSDPLTGFFILKRESFRPVAKMASSSGFKILLDYLFYYRNSPIRVEEVQIAFGARHGGESKLDSRILLEFTDQLLVRLSRGLIPSRFLFFALTGALGVAVHMLAAYWFLQIVGFEFRTAIIGATLTAMVFNFSLNNSITFRRFRLRGLAWFRGLAGFIFVCGLGAIANVGVADYLNSNDNSWQVSALAGVVVGTVFNFALSRQFVWRS